MADHNHRNMGILMTKDPRTQGPKDQGPKDQGDPRTSCVALAFMTQMQLVSLL